MVIDTTSTGTMGELMIHRNALFEDEALTVDGFALNNKQGVLAVARRIDSGGLDAAPHESVIELWNVIGELIFLLKTIPLGNLGAQALLWIDDSDSLLAAHMNGSITVHHAHCRSYETSQVCATPVWCLAAIKARRFCAGTDSGTVLLLELCENQVNVIKTVNIGFGSRVLSLTSNGVIMAAGSLDVIYLIDVTNASIRNTLRLARDQKRKPTVVWCLIFIEGVLASGDSRGCVCIWNINNGALVQTVQTHQADVLSLCVVQNALYASGVDPSIARLNHNKDRTCWRVEHRRLLHNNDVRALIASRLALISGGAEHHFIYSTKNKHHNALKLIPCKMATSASLFLYEYSNRVVIWRTAVAEKITTQNDKQQFFAMNKHPEKLIEFNLSPKEYLFSSAITEDGHLMALAELSAVVLYSLDGLTDKNAPKLRLIQRIPLNASAVVFCSRTLIIASGNFTLHSFAMNSSSQPDDTSTCNLVEFLNPQHDAGEVIRLHCSHDALKVVALTTRNDIYIADLMTRSVRKLNVELANVIMDVRFMNDTALFILCANHERTLLEYSLVDNALSGKAISKEQLSLRNDEFVMDIETHPNGTIVVGSKGTLRIIDARKRKRTVLLVAGATGAVLGMQRPDRCMTARWLVPGRSLLLCTPRVLSEPSLGAFRVKRYGQN